MGPQGPQGLPGARGEAGLTGPQGPIGLTGPRGVAGPEGAQGEIGPAGPAGPAGPIGPQGPIGLTGPQGSKGLNWRGAYSSTTTYVMDDVVSNAGTSYVCIVDSSIGVSTNNTTNWNVIASRGPTGATGATGAAGITWRGEWNPQLNYFVGDTVRHSSGTYRAGITIISTDNLVPGVSNYWIQLSRDGIDGATGPAGPQGPAGPIGMTWKGLYSNTTTYVRNDVVSTSAGSYICIVDSSLNVAPSNATNWNTVSLRGPTGAAGATGPQGEQGVAGPAGPAGQDGAAGPQGPIGLTGPQGPAGPQGIQGPVGPQGPQGPAGPAGTGSGTGADLPEDAMVLLLASNPMPTGWHQTTAFALNNINYVTISKNIPISFLTSPSITGGLTAGSVLTCSPGTFAGKPTPTVAYQWRLNGSNVSGQTSSTYTRTAAANAIPSCIVTLSNGVSNNVSQTATAAATQSTAPSTTTAPTLTPTTGTVGTVFTMTNGTYSGTTPINITRTLTQNGVNVTNQISNNAFTSTASGPLVLTVTASNGTLPNVVTTITRTITASTANTVITSATDGFNVVSLAESHNLTFTPTSDGFTVTGYPS